MDFKKISLKKRQRKKTAKKIIVGFLKYTGIFLLGTLKLAIKPFKRKKNILSGFPKYKNQNRVFSYTVSFIMIFIGGLVAYKVATGTINFFKNFEVNQILAVVGSDLPKDKYGLTNILILGVGGKGHDGEDLTDTMMVASIDPATKSVILFSLPRDFWINAEITSGRINEILRDAPIIYKRQGFAEDVAYQKSIELLENTIENILQIEIHKFAKIDFKGFEKMIDAVDGIDVVVEKTIEDNSYPDGNWGYQRFYLEAGQQHLDGATALKFARSRHNSSDFDRAKRQQVTLQALREKALKKDILTNTDKLKEMFDIVQENFATDLTWREIVSLANYASIFPRENISSRVLTDNDLDIGGFLVTPDRSLYGGAFVLVPFLNLVKDHKYDQIQTFAEFAFYHRDILDLNPPKIHIKNSTNIEGLARSIMNHLWRYGIPIKKISTAEESYEKTTIEFVPTERNKEAASLILRVMDAEVVLLEPNEKLISEEVVELENTSEEDLNNEIVMEENIDDQYDIQIILGKDYQKPFRIPKKADEVKI